jgi:phosphonate transport system substrate-binding protein
MTVRNIIARVLICILFFSVTFSGSYAEQKTLLIGLIPEQNIFRQFQRFLPLTEYLSKRIDREVKLTILSRYGDIIDRFSSRNMDGAFFGVLTGYLAIKKMDVEPSVVPIELDGSSETFGYIIVRRDSRIETVNDMKGKVIAFVDRATVRGYLFPIVYFKRHGIEDIKAFFKEFYFTGSNDASVYAVVDGRADIGCVKANIYEAILTRDPTLTKELKIIASSPLMPLSVLCLKKSLPEDLKSRITEILLNMKNDEEGKKVLKRMELKGFRRASMDDFKIVDDIFKELNISPETYRY